MLFVRNFLDFKIRRINLNYKDLKPSDVIKHPTHGLMSYEPTQETVLSDDIQAISVDTGELVDVKASECETLMRERNM